jgi:hypothetical protein
MNNAQAQPTYTLEQLEQMKAIRENELKGIESEEDSHRAKITFWQHRLETSQNGPVKASIIKELEEINQAIKKLTNAN